MRNFFIVFIAITSFYSCTQDNESLEKEISSLEMASKKSSTNVQLLKAWTANASSPVHQSFIRRFTVKVKNISYEKDVFIHHATRQGTWIDIPLSYKLTIDGTHEIWEGEIDLDSDFLDSEFVIKYVVDGSEYWDNNDGKNYVISKNEGAYLAPGIQVSLNSTYTRYTGRYFNINANVKYNYNAPVEVEIRYTTDNWATYKTAPLSYRRYYRVGYANYIISPNQFDSAIYENSIFVDENMDTIAFALVYKTEGQEYWDNNYGNNYILQKTF